MQIYDKIKLDDLIMPTQASIQKLLFPSKSEAVNTSKRFISIAGNRVPVYTQEFWTSMQRQGASIHEVSYRACFKPQLPNYFISRFSKQEDVVYDPFSGRGTTVIEAALMRRNIVANDANPVSAVLCKPRIHPPTIRQIEERLKEIPFEQNLKANIDLSMFYHPDTESEIVSLRNYLKARKKKGKEDFVDEWIRMVATNRLTGHSKGFFSVYTLPPNQAVTAEKQKKINLIRKQTPPYRNTKEIIIRKSQQLLLRLTEAEKCNLTRAATEARFITGDARKTSSIPDNTVQLVVTSPPFLDIVQYDEDNWLRCWFNNIHLGKISAKITMEKNVSRWGSVMSDVLKELHRVIKPGGWVAFEVGEVRNGKVKLDEEIVPLGIKSGFNCEAVLINAQKFTKTANIWGVKNNVSGTNSNRIVLFRKNNRGSK